MFIKVDNLTAQSDDGVTVKPLFQYPYSLWDDGRRKILIPYETYRGSKGIVSAYCPRAAFEQGAYGKPLPEDLIARIERELPEAFAVLGLRCEIDH